MSGSPPDRQGQKGGQGEGHARGERTARAEV